jgi:hypothetical protein
VRIGTLVIQQPRLRVGEEAQQVQVQGHLSCHIKFMTQSQNDAR